MRSSGRLVTFMILKNSVENVPDELSDVLRHRGWQILRPGHIYALFWDQVLIVDTANTDKLMERVMEVHKVASQLGVDHMFKTVRTSEAGMTYPEFG